MEEKTTFELEVKKYGEVKKEIGKYKDSFNKDTEELDKQISELTEKKKVIFQQNYEIRLDELQKEEDIMKENLLLTLVANKKKSETFDFGMIYYRESSSVKVVDKDKLLALLVEKKLLSKAVKTFDSTFLKKGIEMELFTEDAVTMNSKKSLVFAGSKGGQ